MNLQFSSRLKNWVRQRNNVLLKHSSHVIIPVSHFHSVILTFFNTNIV